MADHPPPSPETEREDYFFPRVGDVFEERFEILELLGTGGYARVYRARQTDLGREVAIKILDPTVDKVTSSQSPTSLDTVAKRFEREARVMSNLRSPHTVAVYEYGRTDEDLLFMVLEHIDGETLGEMELPMRPDEAVNLIEEILESLIEAHGEGLLHRDLKPENIMVYEGVDGDQHAKLLDFGVAKIVGKRRRRARGDADLTAEAARVGTPRYMAPEQLRGEKIGPPRDIYSLGLIAYEMLLGERAVAAADTQQVMARHLSPEPFRFPNKHEIDAELQAIVERMLAKDPEARYSDAEKLLDDLESWADERGTPAPRTTAATPPAPEPTVESDSSSRRYAVLGVVGFVVVSVGAVVVSTYWGGAAEDEDGAPAGASAAVFDTSTPSADTHAASKGQVTADTTSRDANSDSADAVGQNDAESTATGPFGSGDVDSGSAMEGDVEDRDASRDVGPPEGTGGPPPGRGGGRTGRTVEEPPSRTPSRAPESSEPEEPPTPQPKNPNSEPSEPDESDESDESDEEVDFLPVE